MWKLIPAGGAPRSNFDRDFPLLLLPMSNKTPSAYSVPPAHKVSALRQRMIDDMTVRNLAPNSVPDSRGRVLQEW